MNTQNQGDLMVALDIGTTKVVVMAGRKNEYGKLEVLSTAKVESTGVLRGVVSNIEKTVSAITSAIDIAEKKAGEKFTRVNVGIAGQHIKSLQHRGLITRDNIHEEISKLDVTRLVNEMYKLVLPPGDKIIHVIPQEFTVDNEQSIVDPVGMNGVRLEANFHIITGQITAAKNIYKCVEKSGLEVSALTLEPVASSSAVLSEEEKQAGVVLVDIGGGTTDISIFKDGIIRHTAVIPFGGDIVTSDIKLGCQIMPNQAELLKVKFGSALAAEVESNRVITVPGIKGQGPKEISEKNLSLIIQARMEEIFDHVYWEVSSGGYEDQLIAGLVVTGGGSLLRNVEKLAAYKTGLHSRIGHPIEHLAHGYDKELCSPIYSTAIGLVLKAFEDHVKKEIETVVKEDDNNDEDLYDEEDHHFHNHDDKKSGVFDKIFTKTKNWFDLNPEINIK